MRCLVTGAAGFIGSHLCERLLEQRCDIIALDSFNRFYPKKTKLANISHLTGNLNFRLIHDDLSTVDLYGILPGVDYIFHLAAQAGVRTSWGNDFRAYNDWNIMATQRLLEVAKNFKIKKFVYASSSSVYGDATQFPVVEGSILNPSSPYGITKLAAEHLVQLYSKNYNLPTASLRFFTVYGPRQRPDMAFNKFITAILNDDKITIYGDGNQTRDFTYVSDVVDATIAAGESDVDGDIFNIGGGDKISINDVIKLIEKLTQKKAIVEYEDRQRGDVFHTSADITKAKKILGYSPKVTLKEGLAKEIAWLKELYKCQ